MPPLSHIHIPAYIYTAHYLRHFMMCLNYRNINALDTLFPSNNLATQAVFKSFILRTTPTSLSLRWALRKILNVHPFFHNISPNLFRYFLPVKLLFLSQHHLHKNCFVCRRRRARGPTKSARLNHAVSVKMVYQHLTILRIFHS